MPDTIRSLCFRAVLTAGTAAFAALVPALAWGADRPVVSSARIRVDHSRIVGDLDSRYLFSEQVVGTVESGLPAVVELVYRLVDRDDESIHRGVHTYQLRYDVWDDVYSLDGGDTTLTFASFAAMGGAVMRLRGVPIVRVAAVDRGGVYRVEFSIAVHPLRGGEQRKIAGWVDETVRGKSDGTWHEQLLNVNSLIHRFFSHEGEATNRSDWYRTGTFTPASLPSGRVSAGADTTREGP